MGFLDRLLGREEPQPNGSQQGQPQAGGPYGAPQTAPGGPGAGTPTAQTGQPRSEVEIAVERYRYLLRTAPPETIEQVHEEAFSKLTPDQRRLVFQQLSESAPAGEQPRSDDPRSLAQSATRSELRQPGTLERALGRGPRGAGYGGGMGFGGMFASSLLGSVAGYVIGSALVSAFLPSPFDNQADQGSDGLNGDNQNAGDNNDGQGGGGDGSGGDGSGGDGSGSGSGDGGSTQAAGWDGGGDAGSGDAGGWGGDTGAGDAGGWGGGDWGGFGGGDFGGGDFGGGDFI